MDHGPRFVALVDAARTEIREADVATVRQRLAAGDTMTLVDVREPDEVARGTLPGAVAIPRGILERDAEAAFALDAPLVLYCGGGYRSALAARSLGQMGFTDVTSMDGGWRAWTASGFPTDS